MRALLYLIVAFMAVGCVCSDSYGSHRLDAAQAMLVSDPDGAFEMLNACDVNDFQDSSLMARWALLYSEALVGKNIAAPTDTIINIALDYYASHNEARQYAKAMQVKSRLSALDRQDALTTALYIQKEKEFMLYRERMKTERMVWAGVIVLILAIAVIVWQRQRLKVKGLQNEALMAEASGLREGLQSRQRLCSDLQSRLSATLANRFGIIDELCDTYYQSQGTKTEKKAIVDKVKSHIEALKADEGVFAEMEKCHADMLALLREECDALKPDEYRLMVYLASGLSNRTIALLIGESIDTAYKRKSRLKARISSSAMPHKDLFLSQF